MQPHANNERNDTAGGMRNNSKLIRKWKSGEFAGDELLRNLKVPHSVHQYKAFMLYYTLIRHSYIEENFIPRRKGHAKINLRA